MAGNGGRTLANRDDAASVLTRLSRVTAEDTRRWGTMTVHEMLCHLSDAFRAGLAEPPVAKPMRVMGLRGPVAKWVALSLPLPWPHGIRGPAEVDPKRGGTKPAEFAADRDRVEARLRRFIAEVGDGVPHPMFGAMTRADWLRWGWLHMDHHLRQFGR
ncbi:MAG TPA: DUF1569 domain-containing protein [Gemmatimonadales bacterium]